MKTTLIVLCTAAFVEAHLVLFRSSYGDTKSLEAEDDAGTPEGIEKAKRYPYAAGTDKYPFFGGSHPVETVYTSGWQKPSSNEPEAPSPIHQTNLYATSFYGPNNFFPGPVPAFIDSVPVLQQQLPLQYVGGELPYAVPHEAVLNNVRPTMVDGHVNQAVGYGDPNFGAAYRNTGANSNAFGGAFIPSNGGVLGATVPRDSSALGRNYFQNAGALDGYVFQGGNQGSGNFPQNGPLANPLQIGTVATGNMIQNSFPMNQGGSTSNSHSSFLEQSGSMPQDSLMNFGDRFPQNVFVSPNGGTMSPGGSVLPGGGNVNRAESVLQEAVVLQNSQESQNDNVSQIPHSNNVTEVLQTGNVEGSGVIQQDTGVALDPHHDSEEQDSEVIPDEVENWDNNRASSDIDTRDHHINIKQNIHIRHQHSPNDGGSNRNPDARQNVEQARVSNAK